MNEISAHLSNKVTSTAIVILVVMSKDKFQDLVCDSRLIRKMGANVFANILMGGL